MMKLKKGRSACSQLAALLLGAALAFFLTGCELFNEPDPNGGDGERGNAISASWLNARNWTIGENFKTANYTIDHMLSVPNGKTLTIRPGTTITFTTGESGIDVEEGGTIKAVGLPVLLNASGNEIGATPGHITLKGLNSSKGAWKRVAIHSVTDNELDYVHILNGGKGTSAYDCALYLYNGSASVTNCLIDGSASNGITTYNANGFFTAFSNNTIKNCEKAPIYTETAIWSLRNISADNVFTGNTANYLHGASAGSIEADMTIKKMPIPWRIDGWFTVDAEAKLTVEAGTEIRFGDASSGINITENAAVVMAGNSANRITLRGINSSKGAWRRIEIHSTREENKLDHVSIINGGAGTSAYDCALYMYNGSASITNTVIDGSASNGITTYNSNGFFTDFENNTVKNCEKAPIYVESAIWSLRNMGSGNSFTGNQTNYIHVAASTSIAKNMTLKKLNVPYYLQDGLDIDDDSYPILTVEPGAHIFVNGQQNIHVGNKGRLVAVGTEEERIVIRGSQNQAGWWHGVRVDSDVEGTKIAYCDISGGGRADGWSANHCLYIYNAYIELFNVNISKSRFYGVAIEGAQNYIWSSGVTFEACELGNVWNYDTDEVTEELPPNNFTPEVTLK